MIFYYHSIRKRAKNAKKSGGFCIFTPNFIKKIKKKKFVKLLTLYLLDFLKKGKSLSPLRTFFYFLNILCPSAEKISLPADPKILFERARAALIVPVATNPSIIRTTGKHTITPTITINKISVNFSMKSMKDILSIATIIANRSNRIKIPLLFITYIRFLLLKQKEKEL